LVLLILTIFLNFRLAFWVAIGIPVSFAGALILFPSVDLSINLLSAFGFIVVLGIVVDDAIVIGESIYTEKQLRKHIETPEQSIRSTVRGVSKVVTPATFGVITTIAAFVPLTQVSGRMGNVFGQLAIVVIFCLVFSLVESKLILPAHLAHLDVNKSPKNPITKGWAAFRNFIEKITQGFVNKILLPSLRYIAPWRYSVLILFIAILGIFGSMVYSGKIRPQFFPSIFRDFISVNLELEQGQSVEYLHQNGLKIAEAAYTLGEKEKKTCQRVA